MDKAMDKEYSPIGGAAAFAQLSQELALGADSVIIKNKLVRRRTPAHTVTRAHCTPTHCHPRPLHTHTLSPAPRPCHALHAYARSCTSSRRICTAMQTCICKSHAPASRAKYSHWPAWLYGCPPVRVSLG